MKKVIILEHDGGELANQLWTYASIAAYCFERKFALENWSFFEYGKYFAHVKPISFVPGLFFRAFKGYHKRRGTLRTKLLRRLYKLLVVLPRHFSSRVIYSRNSENTPVYLPPTAPASRVLSALENSPGAIYFAQTSGGVFRNPKGFEMYRDKLLEQFSPGQDLQKQVETFLEPQRSRYAHIVGVHIRQGDYKGFKGGKYRIPQARVREIILEYLQESAKNAEHTLFIITSDSPVDENLFIGINVVVSKGTPGKDLFLLSRCDAVLGSDSTFGHFAAWYGNVPHIVMKNEPVDWAYYRGRSTFFWNKYLTVAIIS